MKVTSITTNYRQKTDSKTNANQPAFGNFIKIELPYSMLPDATYFC